MSDSVVKNVILPSHVPITERSGSFSDRFLAATAPLAAIAEDQEEQPGPGAAEDQAEPAAEASAAGPMVPPPTPLAMEGGPAPTPLRGAHDGHDARALGGHAHAEDDRRMALATPAMDDQNDEEEALMRHLSADVK
ncbi:unnamed protein product [Prorocentrum cordatum]|uniref:Uncharacterized protein n=1 Tax=Prorocentrum cordatum TaxID=2364126 RepID=A0ABN9WBY4_9DINO|nr:unnamed protein product [Polarella glacialis]